MSEGQLTPPVNAQDHVAGPDDAPVTLVEYGDFECPYCGMAHPIVKRAQRELGDQLRFIFRNFPLAELHPHARLAAQAAEAAAAQGRFWEMHQMLFEHQDALELQDLIGYAKLLGLDVPRFERELEAGTYAKKVRDDFRSGVRSGVNGTPTFFVNGERYNGSWANEEAVIGARRAAPRSRCIRIPAAGRAVRRFVPAALALLTHAACMTVPVPSSVASAVTTRPFRATADGRTAELFTLTNGHGIRITLTNYGGTITSLSTPDRSGRFDDIVLGYDNLAGYLHDSPYFGAIVGRYGNRIARGSFTLDGKTYRLAVNNGPNSLHGGLRGFDKVIWSAHPFQNQEGTGVALDYTSPDMEEGFPGTLSAHVTYTLTEDDRLIVDYQATTDKATPVNLTQHTYWNLAGSATRDILGHELTINADSMTPVDSTLITTGEITPVNGTPFDFRTPMAIGARVDPRKNTQIR